MTSGNYSEYGIRRVFLDKVEAAAYVTALAASADVWYEPRVETWPVGDVDREMEETPTAYSWTPQDGFTEEFAWDVINRVPAGARAHVVERSASRVVVGGYSEHTVRKTIYDEVGQVKAEAAGIT
ncbi:hypothetical protein [Tsukamurella pulmonis]|uniref:hypothetical protein n=1 Tax=Tsukamurella pulmonis TaxID=47312 RepID=UPI001113742B|nr:hypothetical protein [Tsukamurella pulmonis]